MARIRYLVAGAAVVLWQVPAIAGDPAAAREQLKIGYTLAHEGKCDQALSHLVESLRLDPKAITLINLADCEEQTGKLSDAMSHWIDARARAQAEGAREIEEEAERRAAALEPRLARLTITLAGSAPPDAVVERDGVVLGAPSLGIPLPVNPGRHTIKVKAKGRPESTIEIALGEGEVKRVEVTASAEALPRQPLAAAPREPRVATSPLVYAGFGVAAAGIAAGAITGVVALGAGADAETACPNLRCSQAALDDVEAGRTMGTVSTISFIVAGAGAALGVYGLLWGGKTPADPKVGVSVAPSSVMLRGRF